MQKKITSFNAFIYFKKGKLESRENKLKRSQNTFIIASLKNNDGIIIIRRRGINFSFQVLACRNAVYRFRKSSTTGQ